MLISYLLVAAAAVQSLPVIAPPTPPPTISVRQDSAWPTARPGRVISSPDWSDYSNYPADARARDEEGTVRFSLLVDPSGKPVNCAILISSGSASLDRVSCKLGMQMRFDPGRDENRKAIAATHTTTVNWLLDDPRQFASATLDATLRFDAGRLSGCVARGTGPYVEPWKVAVCDLARTAPQSFASQGQPPAQLLLSIRLDAGDMADPHWPDGTVLMRDQIDFAINSEGDASECTADADGKIFGNDYRSQSPCGQFLSTIWFEEPAKGQRRNGRFELRLIDPIKG